MADAEDPLIDFRTEPDKYRHWRLEVDGHVATLTLDVDESASIFPGVELKLNSYDLGVDIELADAVRRLRFEHPDVRAVVLRSGKERVFCAGANIRMLATASHAHKVNFCKFTNETRNAIEDASAFSGQKYVSVIAGTAAGGGYELALATDHIILADDGSSAVSLPELPLLAVLPGTGGLTRLVDKRRVRRDLADVFCTTEEGVKGRRAREWNLVDELVPRSRLDEAVRRWTDQQPSPAAAGEGISLRRIEREERPDGLAYSTLILSIDRQLRAAMLTVRGPARVPATPDELQAEGGGAWVIAAGRELDDAILHLRFNEPAIGTLIFKTRGDIETVLAYDAFLAANRDHWLAREAVLLWKQVLQRIDLTSRSLVALVEPGSCFGGTMAELAFAADRSYMLLSDAPFAVSAANFGWYPMTNGQCRLAQRLPELDAGSVAIGCPIAGETAEASGLVTFALDEVDWEDEIRIFLEERAAFSPDALTAMEANLRFAGPETMESKIFARLSAWQNWVFQRPNAVGPEGALQRYGTGQKPAFDRRRV